MRRRLTINRSNVLPAVLATAALLSLLMAFQQVVSHAVQRGESMRGAASVQADAAWRCRLAGSRPPSETCRAQALSDRQQRSIPTLEPAPIAPGSPP